MSYARVFLRGWSRREWLTVGVVAITAAFLLGTALLLASAGAYTETLEDDLSGTATVSEYDSLEAAHSAAGSDDVVVPLATASVDGETVTVAGVPTDAPAVLSGASVDWRQARFPDTSRGATGPVTSERTVRFKGDSGSVEIPVRPHAADDDGETETILAPWWYATEPSTVEELGVSSVLVFDSDGGTAGAVPTGRAAPPGTPLIAALPFLLAGVRELLTVLSIAALGGGVLVLVVVYSVTRMSIRDRYDDIRVVRATGGSPQELFAVLCARAGGLVVTGVALGYALGVVLTNAVTNLAVVAGLPVTLSGAVTPAVARLLGGLAGVLVLSGVVAGALAAWPTVRTPPAQLRLQRRTSESAGRSRSLLRSERTDGGRPTGLRARLRDALTPTLLDARAAIPTTATLTVFVFVVLLVGSLWGAFVPLAGAQSGTIVESGAAHPLNSRVDADTADLLQSQGINASAEVIYAGLRDGQPYMVRGADYEDFASVSDARLLRGRTPQSLDEAVIGRGLARTLDVSVGDSIVLGGSVTPGVRRVTVVGMYQSTQASDDMLVVPLEATQGLATGEGQAHLIRTENLSAAEQALVSSSSSEENGIVVTGVSGPSTAVRGQSFDVNVTVRNLDAQQRTSTVALTRESGETLGRESVTLGPNAQRQVSIPVTLDEAGTTTLSVEDYTTSVRVLEPDTLSIPAELPATAPSGAYIAVPVAAPNGSFLAGATVSVDGDSFETASDGVARVQLPPDEGAYTLTASKEGYTQTSREIRIREGATRQLSARVSVTPQTGNALTNPRVDVQVANPWGRTLNRTLALVSPEGRTTRTVELGSGEATRVDIPTSEAGLDERLPPGEYEIRVESAGADGEETVTLATTTYRVVGDTRVLSVVASGGSYSSGTPVGQAIENVFGNVQVLFGAIVLLAGFATIGGTTAAFAQAVHARGRTIGIHRATGATDWQVLRTLIGDACRIALPSTIVAVAIALVSMRLLELSGLLVVFGFRLTTPVVPSVLAMVCLGGIVLSVTSVVVGGYGFLRASPGALLRLRE